MKHTLRAKLLAPLILVLGLVPGLLAPSPAAANVDIYTTPGTHHSGGRVWYTDCEKYSSTVSRCRTDIDATQVKYANGRFSVAQGRVFNNLTYVASPRAQWAGNPLGMTTTWTADDGREWATVCDTPDTGYNGCRSYTWSVVPTRQWNGRAWEYFQTEGWVFNNMVRFTGDHYVTHTGTGNGEFTLPKGVEGFYVRSVHQGDGDFVVAGLDAAGGETEYAAWDEGAVNVGGMLIEPDTQRVRVEATGAWTITIRPLSTAPKLTDAGYSGRGSEVLWYYGTGRTVTVTHGSPYYFSVYQFTPEEGWVEKVDTDGPFNGSVYLSEGPAIIEVLAYEDWSIR